MRTTRSAPPDSAGTAPGTGQTGNYPPPRALDGSLDGCWYTYIADAKWNPSGTYQETGTELFVGCLNGTTCGQFTTTYTFTGKFTGTVELPEEIHGRCQHAITGTGWLHWHVRRHPVQGRRRRW